MTCQSFSTLNELLQSAELYWGKSIGGDSHKVQQQYGHFMFSRSYLTPIPGAWRCISSRTYSSAVISCLVVLVGVYRRAGGRLYHTWYLFRVGGFSRRSSSVAPLHLGSSSVRLFVSSAQSLEGFSQRSSDASFHICSGHARPFASSARSLLGSLPQEVRLLLFCYVACTIVRQFFCSWYRV